MQQIYSYRRGRKSKRGKGEEDSLSEFWGRKAKGMKSLLKMNLELPTFRAPEFDCCFQPITNKRIDEGKEKNFPEVDL